MLLVLVLPLWTGKVGVCLFVRFPWLVRARTPRKCFAHCAGLCLLVRARTQQRFVLSRHASSRAVAVLLAVWLYQPACVRAVLLTVWLTPALCLLMRITALHPAVSLPLPPVQRINSLQQWSAQLPRPLASTSLVTRCPHMHRFEVPFPSLRGAVEGPQYL